MSVRRTLAALAALVVGLVSVPIGPSRHSQWRVGRS